jgi:hypothetical protein
MLLLLIDKLYIYRENKHNLTGTTMSTMEKLWVLGNATLLATRIDRLLWDIVMREVQDDISPMDFDGNWNNRMRREGGCKGGAKEEEAVGALAGGATSKLLLNGETFTQILLLSLICRSRGNDCHGPPKCSCTGSNQVQWG